MLTPELTIAVGPAGEWGSGFAKSVAENHPHKVRILLKEEDLRWFEQTRETRRLPGTVMPENVTATSNMKELIHEADLIVFASKSQGFRPFYYTARPFMDPRQLALIITKGLELGTNLRMSQIPLEKYPTMIDRVAVLSGPNLAKDVARSELAGAVIAAYDINTAKQIQSWIHSEEFRVYTTDDVAGVEYGGALKNVMAIGAGIIGFQNRSDTTKALYFARALEEMVRFATALGAHERTITSLAMVGDLHLSCSGPATRNYRAGMRLAEGWTKEEVLAAELVEGLYAIDSVIKLAEDNNIDIPLMQTIHKICNGTTPDEAENQLMGRPATVEQSADKGLLYSVARIEMRVLHNLGIKI